MSKAHGSGSMIFPYCITLPPGIFIQGADPQICIPRLGKGKVFAREVLRGVAYLIAFSLTATGLWGQQRSTGATVWTGGNNPNNPSRQLEELENEADQRDSTTGRAMQPPSLTCIFVPYPGFSNTVSVRSLEVPEKMQNEYQKACTALQSKKAAEAEKHLRKALQYAQDALGWLMLGRVLESMERWDEATKACTEALVHDPSYWAAEICLAEIDAHQRKWKNSIEESNRALSMNLDSKRVAYYISAIALFNLNQISDAESRALEAEKLDGDHKLQGLQLILARIDEIKGDLRAAETRLRDCLRYAKNPLEGNLAKQELARLGTAPN
jgi:tetratricopeptide (TPR) repeat protein